VSPDPTAIPAVLFDLADVLPQFQGAYRAQYAANFAPRPEVEPPGPASPAPPHEPRYSGGSRIVDERAYQTAIRKAKARKDPTHESRTGGILERWIDPNGRVVAWIHVRYFQGEEEYDYFVAS
jgi:hypothetical protein